MPESSRSTGNHRSPAEAAERREQAQALGERVKKYRQERGLNLSQLASAAHLSKSYVSAIEAGEAPRPSGETLYAIAEAVGVLMSDLLGRQVLPTRAPDYPQSLIDYATEASLPEADIKMLASIQFRGEQPSTKDRWALIYSTIRQTEWMDREKGSRSLSE